MAPDGEEDFGPIFPLEGSGAITLPGDPRRASWGSASRPGSLLELPRGGGGGRELSTPPEWREKTDFWPGIAGEQARGAPDIHSMTTHMATNFSAWTIRSPLDLPCLGLSSVLDDVRTIAISTRLVFWVGFLAFSGFAIIVFGMWAEHAALWGYILVGVLAVIAMLPKPPGRHISTTASLGYPASVASRSAPDRRS